MKSQIFSTKNPESRNYPYLGIHKNGQIVLFGAEVAGVALCNPMMPSSIGQYRSDWIENLFEVFEDKLILEND